MTSDGSKFCYQVKALLLRPLFVQHGIDADAPCQVGCEQALRIELSLDRQQILVARVDPIELFGPQDLVLGKVNLAATAGCRIDKAVDRFAAGCLRVFLGVKLEVEAVTILGK